jgi:hypothetical protein
MSNGGGEEEDVAENQAECFADNTESIDRC